MNKLITFDYIKSGSRSINTLSYLFMTKSSESPATLSGARNDVSTREELHSEANDWFKHTGCERWQCIAWVVDITRITHETRQKKSS